MPLLTTLIGDSEPGSLAVERLAPSEDFLNLVSEDMAPERYGRTPELDAEDLKIWSAMIQPRRHMQLLAVLRYCIMAVALLSMTIMTVIYGIGALLRFV